MRTLTLPAQEAGTSTDRGFDRYLGPASSRYFGSGYRKVAYGIDRIGIHPGRSALSAVGSVGYPVDWSVKDGRQSRAHLSTIDGVTLALVLSHMLDAEANDGTRSLARSIEVRAGAKAMTELHAVPLSLRRAVGDSAVETQDGPTFTSRIGTLSVTIGTWATSGPRVGVQAHGPAPSHLAFTGDHAHATDYVSELVAQPSHRSSASFDHWASARADTAGEHPVGEYAARFVDPLVLAGQMAEVLLYSRAGVDRASTGNLWMRRAAVQLSSRSAESPSFCHATIRVTKELTIERNGRRLQCVDILVDDLFGTRIAASLAYEVATTQPRVVG
ncbi:AvrD family protein [Leifsonia sp. TF02-11]|uniref:AvrD family protein n=1 Tax=Leifsonia sp. TF02-11 TaxID=2815212 RepID=UPI001AA11EDA|nr:AvrD family protein [Leifsonia sp. TF02-11]MBO1739299.1 hypothetical protein [Leifsonia sp. TF02-11]